MAAAAGQGGLVALWAALGHPDRFLETVPDARRAPSAIHGEGLFSTRARAAGEHVVTLDGQAVPLAALPEALFALEWNALSDRVLLVRPIRTSYGYINHAPVPNLAIAADGVTVSTVRPVAAGQELTLDYRAQPLPAGYLAAPQGAYLLAAPD